MKVGEVKQYLIQALNMGTCPKASQGTTDTAGFVADTAEPEEAAPVLAEAPADPARAVAGVVAAEPDDHFRLR